MPRVLSPRVGIAPVILVLGLALVGVLALVSFNRPQLLHTWWFQPATTGLVSLELVLLYRLRVKRRERELEALVARRTEELRQASLRDSLTGLRSRRFVREVVTPDALVFAERKRHLLENGGPSATHPLESCLGVFMIVIDQFKSINDAMGPEAGDRVLERFSEVLRREVRKDDVVVRWGEEEFLVVLRHVADDFLETFADRIRNAVAKTEFVAVRSPRKTVRRSCSIGYVTFPFYKDVPDLVSLEQAIMIAGLGLHHSKRSGGNLAVGIEPGDRIPRSGDLLRTLTSLEFGTQNEYLRIQEAKTPRPLGVTA